MARPHMPAQRLQRVLVCDAAGMWPQEWRVVQALNPARSECRSCPGFAGFCFHSFRPLTPR